MDVDLQCSSIEGLSDVPGRQEKLVKLHPLAIIGISDHYTRVVTGGSNLSKDSPVMGLLMGYHDGPDIVYISDAEEIEYFIGVGEKMQTVEGSNEEEQYRNYKANIQTKIRLHQEVFPHHELVGWYRVGDEVTPEDLTIQAEFAKEYAANTAVIESSSLLFVLMNPNAFMNDTNSESRNYSQDLPITVYEALVTSDLQQQSRTVFVGLSFELSTGQPERIVIEKVFCEQLSTTESNESGGPYEGKLQTLSSSLVSLNSCTSILLEFLRHTQSGKIPPDYKLLRQIHNLLSQLPILTNPTDLSQEVMDGYNDAWMISFLAAVSKTAKALQKYSEKFHCYQESLANAGRNREARKGY